MSIRVRIPLRVIDSLNAYPYPTVDWSILKYFFGDKRISIVPLLLYNNKYISDFKVKADIFNNHFSTYCSLIPSSSSIPDEIFATLPHSSLSSLTIDVDMFIEYNSFT